MLKTSQQVILTLLRLSIGWLFLYAGVTKVIDPSWSAAGYIGNAQTFHTFFAWLAQPNILPFVNFLNEWGLTLLGVALILGVFVRVASLASFVLMVLYYLPILNFPHAGDHSFIVDEHVIYMLVLLLLYYFNAGRYFGLDKFRR